jgi:predicted CoA-substrate-specific enzyme activase
VLRAAGSRLGIDIGSVTLKLAAIDEDGRVLYSSYEKHHGAPLPVLLRALKKLQGDASVAELSSAAVTGSGRDLVSAALGMPAVNEIVAQATAVAHYRSGTRTIIEIGGQDSKFIRLGEARKSGGPVILTQRMNDICAAGTGAFVEQQAEKLDVPVEEFGGLALESQNPATVAGRCAVFSKTDIVHLRQEGAPSADIAAGICTAVARNYIAQFLKGRKCQTPVIFQGGLAANAGVVRAFRQLLDLSADELVVPEHFKVMAAIGAALLAHPDGEGEHPSLEALIAALELLLGESGGSGHTVNRLPRLTGGARPFPTLPAAAARAGERVFVGIDVGSTSTCVAVMSERNQLLASSYTLNRGSMIDSVNSAMAGVCEELGARAPQLDVRGVGVTGSGRALVSRYIGADLVRDEISAQARAAAHMLPEADTVFEIGGQDSKYIRICDGRVVDFELNKVCAAGTGSFLQEQSGRLGTDLAGLGLGALRSQRPVDLGSRCTVFMESDLVHYQQRGVATEDLAAGLCYSVARNYLEKVVGGRPVGERVLFLGGVALNPAVVSAFGQLLKKEMIVPEHHEISAAIGMALMAREDADARGEGTSQFVGFEPRGEGYRVTSFQCEGCEQSCRISRVSNNGSSFCFGGACGKHEGRTRDRGLRNLFAEREELLLSSHRPGDGDGRERVGIARAHLFFEFFPLWCTFLQELGYEVVLSDRTCPDIVSAALERTSIDNCFASKLVYGHVNDLLGKGVSKVFLPTVVEFQRRIKDIERNYACPHVQSMPALVGAAFPEVEIISPVFVRDRRDRDWQKELKRLGRRLGGSRQVVDRAVRLAARAQDQFHEKCETLGRELLEDLPAGQRVVAVMGKIYSTCDPGLNLNVAERLLDMGVLPVPYDCLPLSKQPLPANYSDMVWSAGQDLMRAARAVIEDPRLSPMLVTGFGCGPDSFAIKYLEELFRDRGFLVLEVDEHSSAIGAVTRIEAFLNNLQTPPEDEGFAELSSAFRPFVPSARATHRDRLIYVPLAFDSFRPFAAALESVGVRTRFLPEHDAETARLGREHTSGKECLPYIMLVGDAVRMTRDPEFHPERSALYLPASDLACRISLMPTSMKLVLRDLGFPDVPVVAPRISMDRDEILSVFGVKFAKNLFRGMLSIELLGRLVTERRPYEKLKGACDRAYEEGLRRICASLAEGRFWSALDEVLLSFDGIELEANRNRPVIGLVGDDYARANSFANNDFVREIESLGGEVSNVPIWSSYMEFQMAMKPRKALRRGRYAEFAFDSFKSAIGRMDMGRIRKAFSGRLKCYPDPDFHQMISSTSQYLHEKSEPLAIMALSHILHLLRHGVDGIANLVGFQCMIHSIVAANLGAICARHGNTPTLTLFCDLQEQVHQRNRMEAFMFQVQQYRERSAAVVG